MNLDNFNTIAFLILTSIGISAAPNEFIGGMCLAIAAGYLYAIWNPEKNKREMRVMIFTSIVLAIFGAILRQHLFPSIPIQIAMGVTGFLAKPLAARMVERSDELTDSIIDRTVGTEKKDHNDG